MIKPIIEKQSAIIEKLLSSMTIEEKAGQVQCINAGNLSKSEIQALIKKHHIGSFFVGNTDRDRLKEVNDAVADCKIPVIINGDFVNGVGSRIERLTGFPQQLACSASNDTELIEEMGRITATEGRGWGAHWTFGPVIDLCYNLQNPMMHIRTSGDNPEQVLKIGKAFMEGVQKTGYMAATAKHFPGDGTDSRDTHITTLINHLSREEWENTYGYIWRGMIDAGVMSIMSGHIALPFVDGMYESEKDRYKGLPPASLSKKILVGFLRDELGFDGAIVTDAINMIGLGAHMKREDYALKLLLAGNDMLLWTKPEIDTARILNAVANSELPMERLDDAVRRILELKARVGLLDNEVTAPVVDQTMIDKHGETAQKVADKSITILRDVFGAIPCSDLKKGSKVLTVTLTFVEGIRNKRDADDLIYVDEMLRERGFEVEHLLNPDGLGGLDKIAKNYDKIFINFKYPAKYGTLRLCGDAISALKGSWWVENPNVIFTAFGEPYKIYDLPSLHSYIMTYSIRKTSQRAAVKVWLGEIEAEGICPVDMSCYKI